eukprot:131327-Pyramimonas_sp.AAC.1
MLCQTHLGRLQSSVKPSEAILHFCGPAAGSERRRWAAGGHHHRPASNLYPFSSQKAFRETGRRR